MIEYDYYCTKCGAKASSSMLKCSQCKANLIPDGAIKKVTRQLHESIYSNSSDNVSTLSTKEKERLKNFETISQFPPIAAIILHIITLGFFSMIYYGVTHGKFPQATENDPSTVWAIGGWFIPVYNLYWTFGFWLTLVDRINLQYTLRKKVAPLNRTFVLITRWLSFGLLIYIPFVNLLWFVGSLILMPITIWKVQTALNNLGSLK